MYRYGNYCGPNWSDNKWQSSVEYGESEPVDELDSHCRDHDRSYARGDNLENADILFARRTIGGGLHSTAVGSLVGLQGLSRRAVRRAKALLRGLNMKDRAAHSLENVDFEIVEMPKKSKYGLRRETPPPTPKVLAKPATAPVKRKPLPVMEVGVAAPVSLGGVVRSNTRRVVNEKYNTARIQGSSYGTRVNIRNTSTTREYYLAACMPLNPAHFTDRFAEVYAGLFEKFRFRNLAVEYFSECPTNVAGGIVVCYVEDIVATLPNETNGGVLQQTMSQTNATWTNVWNHMGNIVISLPDKEWRFTNTTVGKSMNDMYAGYIVAYIDVPAGTTSFGGNLAIHYDVEYESRTLVQPVNIPRSPGARAYMNIGAGSGLVIINLNTLGGASHIGGVGMMYVDTSDSVLGAGPSSFNTLLATTGAKGNIQLTSGAPIFFALHDVTGVVGNLYPDYESAVTDSQELIYSTTTTTDTFLSVIGFWIISNPAIES